MADETWTSDAEWDAGAKSGIVTSGGSFSLKQFAEGTVFDDWADNSLTSRDTFATTAYDESAIPGSTPSDRPEWSHQQTGGSSVLEASGGRLKIRWNTADPVSEVACPASFDETSIGLTNWYIEFAFTVTAVNSAMAWHYILGDYTDFSSNGYYALLDQDDSQITLRKVEGGTTSDIKTVGSLIMTESTVYGLLVQRDGSGGWTVYFDPADPANPQASEEIHSFTDTYLPDMATGGIGFAAFNDGTQLEIERMEVF